MHTLTWNPKKHVKQSDEPKHTYALVSTKDSTTTNRYWVKKEATIAPKS
jgi:hypothetical protein